ncbi:MAG: HDOD domain-containing protein [Gammaproteobacteria bacterium]|nr:HDOD domain-containing protein [Gammaproteobacteria bacterium]
MSTQISIKDLKQFNHFAQGNEIRLQSIIDHVQVSNVPKGAKIIELGDTSEFGYFLLSGSLILKAADGGVKVIEAGTESARNQVAQLVPRRYQVISSTPVTYLKVPNPLLNAFHGAGSEEMESSIILEEDGVGGSDEETQTASEFAFENEISYQLYQELQNDTLVLPSLPDIAIRVGEALKDETKNVHHIAEIAQTDPAITAKLVKAANSAMYGGSGKVDSCSGAVIRLGTQVTHQLVMTFAMKELFQTSSKLLNRRMKRLWEHSARVAAVSHVLAKKLGKFDPEHALLAGLVHDIGVLAIINYATQFPEAQENRQILDSTIKSLRGQVGSMILTKWGFPEDLPAVAADAENWTRSPASKRADYTDIVIIAQLHSFIGTDDMATAPAIDAVPSFKRLGLSQLTPKMSLKLLDEAKEEIAEARALLTA